MESETLQHHAQLLEMCYHVLSQIIPYSSKTVCIRVNLDERDTSWSFYSLGNGEWKVERFPLQWTIEEDCVLEWIRSIVESTVKTMKISCITSGANFIEYQEIVDGSKRIYRIL